METDLMQRALESAPWLAPFMLVAVLLRKEIGALLTAGRSDSDMEKLMAKMVEQFAQNLEFFKAVAGHTETMQSALTEIKRTSAELVEVQRGVAMEVARQGGRR